MYDGKQVFKELCEQCEEPGTYNLVTRDPALQDDAKLPEAFMMRVGDVLVDKFVKEEPSLLDSLNSMPQTKGTSADVLTPIKVFLEYMQGQGYCVGYEIDEKGDNDFRVKLFAPANIWAVQYVNSKGRTAPLPIYDAYVIACLLRKARRQAKCTFRWTRNTITEEWTLV